MEYVTNTKKNKNIGQPLVVRSCFSYVNSNVNNFNVLQNWEKNHLPEAAPVYLEAAVLLLFNGIRNNMNILVKI